MKTAIFGDIVVQLPDDWDGCMPELQDRLKDAAVYALLTELDAYQYDCFPQCAHDITNQLVTVLYADGTDEMFEALMEDARVRYATAMGVTEEEMPDHFYSSEAVGNFKDYVGGSEWFGTQRSLADTFRDSLYLYFERDLEHALTQQFKQSIH